MLGKSVLKDLFVVSMIAGALCLNTTLPSVAADDDAGVKKSASLVNESAYHFTRLTPKIWSIDFTGKALQKFKVLVVGDDLMVIFVIVVDHDKYTMTPDLAKKLLSFDSSMDRVKIGVNQTGDIFVRADVTTRTMDEDEFKVNVEQVAAASDEVYGGIQSMLSNKSPFK